MAQEYRAMDVPPSRWGDDQLSAHVLDRAPLAPTGFGPLQATISDSNALRRGLKIELEHPATKGHVPP